MAPLSLKVVQDTGAVVTRTVKVDSKDVVEKVLDVVREKFMISTDGNEYGLFLTAADDDLSGIWLEHSRNLEYYMLRDGDTLLLLTKTRNLRLRMLDGSVKTVQVDESEPISRVMAGICARIGITNHEEYGLCYDDDEGDESRVSSAGTLTLKRPPQKERDAKLEHMSKKLKTDDNVRWLDMHRTLREMEVGPRDTLLLKRRLFYTDRNVDPRDPVQLNLLYVQTRDAILDGRHPVTQEQACEFAGLQCQIQYGDYQEEKHKTGYLEHYKELLPDNMANRSGLEKKILKEYQKHQGLSDLEAKHLYTKTARELPTYGVTFFVVKEKQQKGKKKLVPRLLGISANAVLRLDEETKEILQAWPLTQVKSYQVGKSHTFTLNFGDYSDKEYCVKTNDAVRIRDILQGYIDIIAKRLAGARNINMNDGHAVMEDSVQMARAHIIQHVKNNPSKIVEETFVGPTKILSYVPGQPVSQGTQLVTVQQMIISNTMSNQQYTITGEVAHRKGVSLDFVRKLNKMNSNSVKVVNLINTEEGSNRDEIRNTVSGMESDMPLIISGINETVKKDLDDGTRKRMLDELQELIDCMNSLTQHVNSPEIDYGATLEAASRVADVSTRMYLGLDPVTKRRSNLINMSRQSFIEDEKMDANLRRASFIAASAGACNAVDEAIAIMNQVYKGPELTSSEGEDLERAARDMMRKLNGAVALFLTAHADPENVDYAAAVTSMNTIKELITELAQDTQALASMREASSKQELIDDVNKLCDVTRLVCSLTGCTDHQKLLDVTNAYGPVADKLIFMFGRGRRDDHDSRIVDLAKKVVEKTSLLLTKANELTSLVPSPQAEHLDEAGVQCAGAASDLLSCAMLTSSCIHEPHCQSALTASAETLASAVQKLLIASKPAVDGPDMRHHGDDMKQLSLELAKALDALKNFYGNDDRVNSDPDLAKDPQRLKFIMRLAETGKDLEEAEKEMYKSSTISKLDHNPVIVAMLEKNLAKRIEEYNAGVAALLLAVTDRDNSDYAAADAALVTVNDSMTGILRDTKSLAASKDEVTRRTLLEDVRILCESTRGICAGACSNNMTELNDTAGDLAITASKLYFTFKPAVSAEKEQQILDIATAACTKASQMLSTVYQLAEEADAAVGNVLDAQGATTADGAKTLLTCAQLTAASINNPSSQSALIRAADFLSTSSSELLDISSKIDNPLVDHIRKEHKELQDELARLRKACPGVKEGTGRSAEEEQHRLNLEKSTADARRRVVEIENEIDKPFHESLPKGKIVLARQQQLSDAMSKLSSAIAALTAATADPDDVDYLAANEAMTTITELMPLVVIDTKTLASTKDAKTRDAMMAELRSLCAATREICDHQHDPHLLRESAKKFGSASRELVFVLNPQTKADDANKIRKHANLVCNTAKQLVKESFNLIDKLYATDLAGDKLKRAANKTMATVDALLTVTQLTSPSLGNLHCQSELLSSIEALSLSAHHLAQQWAPIQAVDKQELVSRLDQKHGVLQGLLENMRKECQGDYISSSMIPDESKFETKKSKRVHFADTVSEVKRCLRDVDEELAKPYISAPAKGEELVFKQLELSNGLARLNAALAALAVATANLDNVDYPAAERAMKTVSEALPQVVKDTKSMSCSREDVPKGLLLDYARALCAASKEICDVTGTSTGTNAKALRNSAKKFAAASGKLIYMVNSQAKPIIAKQVMETTHAACLTANRLVKNSACLTDHLLPSDQSVSQIANSGRRTADAADALITAATLTAPCLNDPNCQTSLSSSIDVLSSSAQELRSHWTPYLQEPMLTAVIKELERENQQLTRDLDQLRDCCNVSEKDDIIINKAKPVPSPKPKDADIRLKQALGKISYVLKDAEEDIKKVYNSSLETPSMHKDQVKMIQKALEKKIALTNAVISELLVCDGTESTDCEKRVWELAPLVRDITKDAKVLSNSMTEKQRKAFLDDILAMFDALNKVVDARESNKNNLNGATAEYGDKSAAILYSVCTDYDPNQEKEVISRVKVIGEILSEIATGSSTLVPDICEDEANKLCAAGKACAKAAENLVYTAKLVAPSIQIAECQNIIKNACQTLSNKIKEFSATWNPLSKDLRHKACIDELYAKTAKAEGLLDALKKDLDSGKLVKLRPSEDFVTEETPLRKLTAALVDNAFKKSSDPALSPELKLKYANYARALNDAAEQLDRANAACKKEPHNLEKSRELEDAVQNVQVLALQKIHEIDNQHQYIVDLTEYVKELSQEADKMINVNSACSTKYKDIDDNCQHIIKEADSILRPSHDHKKGDSTFVDDIHQVDRFGRSSDDKVKKIASQIKVLPDSNDKSALTAQSEHLEYNCNMLRFATQSAIANTQSASLDDTLHTLVGLEKRIDEMLKSGQDRYIDEPVPWPVRCALLQAAQGVSSQHNLGASLTQYIDEQKIRTNFDDSDAKLRLEEHLKKLVYLLKTSLIEKGRRIATWQELDRPEVSIITEQVIKEIDRGCSFNKKAGQKTILQDIDINRLLLSTDVVKTEGDRVVLEDKLQQSATKLSSLLSTLVSSSTSSKSSLARSVSISIAAAGEVSALARALKSDDPVYNAKLEEAARDVRFQTYNVVKESEVVAQEPNSLTRQRRLLEACRLLNNALNNLTRTTSTKNKIYHECNELIRNLQFQNTLLINVQPANMLPYAECLDAMLNQQEVIQKLNSDQPMSKTEFSRTLRYVSSAVSNTTELAAQCGYLLSLSQRDREFAKNGVVDVHLLKKATEATQATCYKTLYSDPQQAKEEISNLISQSNIFREVLLEAENRSQPLKKDLESARMNLEKFIDELKGSRDLKAEQMTSITNQILDVTRTVLNLSEHPGLIPGVGQLSTEERQRQEHVILDARDLTRKTVALISEVKRHEDSNSDDDGPMTWVTFKLKRRDVVKAFEALLIGVRENGQRAGLLDHKQGEEENPKSFVQLQLEVTNKWLKRPNCKLEVKVAGEEAVLKLINIAEKLTEEMKTSEKEDLCVLIAETKDLLSECSKKCSPDKASVLVERLKSLKKAIERGVVTMVVDDFIDGEEPLQDLDILVDSEKDETKRKFILERKIAELLAQLGRVTRTARTVADVTGQQQAVKLTACTDQANLLAPLLVKAAQDRISTPNNKAAIENYQSLLAQYAESLSKVRDLCDRSVDPMEFVQTAGETMQRMREESSHENDPQKCVYTSSAITKLANRVIQVSMSSSNAKQDPELHKALSEAQQRLLAAVPDPETRRSKVPDWKDTTAEILRTTGEVEAVMGGEMIFQNQPQSDQPIFVAARELHTAVREWSARDNELVAVARKMAVLMAKLSAYMNNNKKHDLITTSKSIVSNSHEVVELARKLAHECTDVRIKTNLLQVCDQIPTISGQLKMLTTVKGATLANPGSKEDQDSLNMLVDNAQNLMLSIQQVVKVSAGASVKIASQRGGLRVKWVRKAYYY
ncbi:talin-1 isoform X2 [Amyelois transitella]|uniref:talin-1 isoform X2 n=1 Tax=Amyelois transitella TaxID=680683 RepID=UPI0029901C94|nr:talin-1 isoform X2 [Amyelois transitella]